MSKRPHFQKPHITMTWNLSLTNPFIHVSFIFVFYRILQNSLLYIVQRIYSEMSISEAKISLVNLRMCSS